MPMRVGHNIRGGATSFRQSFSSLGGPLFGTSTKPPKPRGKGLKSSHFGKTKEGTIKHGHSFALEGEIQGTLTWKGACSVCQTQLAGYCPRECDGQILWPLGPSWPQQFGGGGVGLTTEPSLFTRKYCNLSPSQLTCFIGVLSQDCHMEDIPVFLRYCVVFPDIFVFTSDIGRQLGKHNMYESLL